MCGLSQDCQVFRTFPAVFFLSPSQYIFLCLIPGDTILPSEEYIFGIYLLEYLCFLRTAEELHTGEVKSLPPNLSHAPAAGADSAPSTWSLRPISRGICMLPARGASDLARGFSSWYRPWPHFSRHLHVPSTWSLRPGAMVPTLAAFLAAFACSQHVEPPTWHDRADSGCISRGICMLPARGASDRARCFSSWCRLWGAFLAAFACFQHVEPPTWRDASVAGTDSCPFCVAFRHWISSSKPVEQCCCARSSD